MSYTFSRRDFMKYTALAAAAVAVSGSLTGCSNPNQPSGKIGETLSFGASDSIFGFGGSSDKHTLTSVTYDLGVLTCDIQHKPVGDSFSCGKDRYAIIVDYENGDTKEFNSTSDGIEVNGTGETAMDSGKTYPAQVTFKNIDFTDAKKVWFRYYPHYTAIENKTDYMKDVRATWDITSVVIAG